MTQPGIEPGNSWSQSGRSTTELLCRWNGQVQKLKKVTKIKMMIMSKPHIHLQTMTKGPAKFQINQYKTVGGVAHTRYPLFKPRKWLSSKVKKVTKIKLLIMPISYAYLQTLTKDPAKFQTDWYRIVWGVAQTMYPPSVVKIGKYLCKGNADGKTKKYESAYFSCWWYI